MSRGGAFFAADSGIRTIDGSGTNLLAILNPADSTERLYVRVIDASCSDIANITISVCTGMSGGTAVTPVALQRPEPFASEITAKYGTKTTALTVTGATAFRTAEVPKQGPTFIPLYEEVILYAGHGIAVNILPAADGDTAQVYIEWRQD